MVQYLVERHSHAGLEQMLLYYYMYFVCTLRQHTLCPGVHLGFEIWRGGGGVDNIAVGGWLAWDQGGTPKINMYDLNTMSVFDEIQSE